MSSKVDTKNLDSNDMEYIDFSEERQVSFSFNLDLDNSDSCDSADSETANLQIDVSEVHDSNPPNKKRRLTTEETSVFNEMEEEIERQLDAKAAKTNLTPINVKNILKHVISDEQVKAMVQRQLKNSSEDFVFEPKLTRSKAKQLAITQQDIPWHITPIKTQPASEVQALIETELSEDSSDEEYDPENEEQSEDEREAENSVGSDIESLPSTPQSKSETTVSGDQDKMTSAKYDDEGVFKIPETPPAVVEEESIGQRTRSKLSLSETPLEQIEQAFIPPDITTDLYDWDVERLDEPYKEFLRDYLTKPLNHEPVAEDDPEADPEYNFMEDIETDIVDKEEFREDKGVEISRKEYVDLLRSLHDFGYTNLKKEQEAKKKKKNPENNNTITNINNTPVENNVTNTVVEVVQAPAEPEKPELFTFEQRQLFKVQMEQHVQLLTQIFLTSYKHPDYHPVSRTCKANLDSLKYLRTGPSSAFNACNLEDAHKTMSIWETKLLDKTFCDEYVTMVNDEIIAEQIHLQKKLSYNPRFHPALKTVIIESKALVYPQLLPHTFSRMKGKSWNKGPLFPSEEYLILLGLEKFYPVVLQKNTQFKRKNDILIDVVQMIQENLLPIREFNSILNYIKKCRRDKKTNYIKSFFDNGSMPSTIHQIMMNYDYIAPKDQPPDLLPSVFKNHYIKDDNFKRHSLRNLFHQLKYESKGSIIKNQAVTNPVINVYINIPTQENPVKVVISDDTLIPGHSSGNSTVSENSAVTENSVVSENSSPHRHSPEPFPEPHLRASPLFIKCEQMNFEENDIAEDRTTPSPNQDLLKKNTTIIENAASSSNQSSNNQTEESEALSLQVENKDGGKSTEECEKSEEGYKLPQLRKTTPRLAKIRSAENMKLMAQALGPKGLFSNCGNVKGKGKQDISKTDDECSSSTKGDNEDEIAELMLASTTIKKDTVSRKKAKEARELENIKRLVESENDNNHEERATKFAASFFQKLQSVTSCDSTTFAAVINLYLSYCDKISALDRLEADEEKEMQDESISDTASATMSSVASERCKDKYSDKKDEVAVELYTKVCDCLSAYPELCSDFLLFLTPHQAALVDKSVEYTMLQKMKEFINVAQVYFAKKPSRLAKLTQALTSLTSDPLCTIESVKEAISPILKGHSVVMNLFMQVLPEGKPPDSLFAPHMFENLLCPVGPHDKNKVYTEDSAELYENIKLPVRTSQDEPHGSESCKCDCHAEIVDSKTKIINEHCASCGTKFVNGRIYLQTPEGLRPAKITFPGADEERLENIARVSLKPAEKIITVPPVKRRKRNSKSESESNAKTSKLSPVKDNDESGEKKSRKGAKSPPKLTEQQRKMIKIEPGLSSPTVEATNKKQTTLTKNVREKRVERKEQKLSPTQIKQEPNSEDYATQFDSNNSISSENNETSLNDITYEDLSSSENADQTETTSCSDNETKPWTREEDTILLKKVKEGFNNNTFQIVSSCLKNRSVQEVKERFNVLLSLLKKMN